VVCRSACRSVGHSSDPCENGSTDRDAIWVEDSSGPKEACSRWSAHCRRLANTTEPVACGGDAAFLSNYFDHLLLLLWPLCVADADIIFLPCGFYLSSSFSPPIISAVANWMSPILAHMVWLSANLRCRCETCCTALAANTGCKKSSKIAIWALSHNFVGLYLRK